MKVFLFEHCIQNEDRNLGLPILPNDLKIEIESNLIKKKATDYFVALSDEDLFLFFTQHFAQMKAGGGLVFNPKQELLMIYRRKHWDLPKGKLDVGETIEECAVREVAEETNASKIKLGKPLENSYHLYQQNDEWIFKITYWFKMNIDSEQKLIPQAEEDIEKIEWVSKDNLNKYLPKTYKSLRSLLLNSFD